MHDDLRTGARFARTLAGYLRTPLDADTGWDRLRRAAADREAAFLHLVDRAIFRSPASPYRPLFDAAGIELGDLRRLVAEGGVEGALERLFDAGVRMSLDEFKGRRPIKRGSFERAVHPRDFDSPLVGPAYGLHSGGSRGTPRRIVFDLSLLEHEACMEAVYAAREPALSGRMAMWRPIPPGSAGLKVALRRAKIGRSLERWFTQHPVSFANGNARHSAVFMFTYGVGRLYGHGFPWPEYVPIDQAATVAAWLANERAAGRQPALDANCSSTVRVCRAALDRGLDISGTAFRAGGEPFTAGKARVVAQAGCRAFIHYSMTEVGRIGIACAFPSEVDEVHFLEDKLALIQRPVATGADGSSVDAIFLTTLHPGSPKIMLNVDSGDYGRILRRSCGCFLEELGFHRRFASIRSHDKLTSEGMHFMGDDLVAIVDDLLPTRFGGSGVDYQFVEEEEEGLPKVNLLVSPRLGEIGSDMVRSVVLEALARGGAAQAMMARRWQEGETLRIVRREPYATPATKVLALHSNRPRA